MPTEVNPHRSDLDQTQIFQRAFNEDLDRIRVDAEISASIIAPPGLEVSISSVDDNIAIRNSNNSNELLINSNGSINTTTIQLFTLPYDAITATYPSAAQEVYQSRIGGISGTVQQTITVNYTDSTKVNLLNAART